MYFLDIWIFVLSGAMVGTHPTFLVDHLQSSHSIQIPKFP